MAVDTQFDQRLDKLLQQLVQFRDTYSNQVKDFESFRASLRELKDQHFENFQQT